MDTLVITTLYGAIAIVVAIYAQVVDLRRRPRLRASIVYMLTGVVWPVILVGAAWMWARQRWCGQQSTRSLTRRVP